VRVPRILPRPAELGRLGMGRTSSVTSVGQRKSGGGGCAWGWWWRVGVPVVMGCGSEGNPHEVESAASSKPERAMLPRTGGVLLKSPQRARNVAAHLRIPACVPHPVPLGMPSVSGAPSGGRWGPGRWREGKVAWGKSRSPAVAAAAPWGRGVG